MQVSLFGGVIGDVVRHFVRPTTYLRALPALAIAALLTSAARAAIDRTHLPAPFAVLVLLIALGPVFALYAVPARYGDLDTGLLAARNYLGQVSDYVGRYALAVMLWGLPFAAAFSWLARTNSRLVTLRFSLAGADSVNVAMIVAWVGAFTLQFISLIVALRAERLADVLVPGAWYWVVRERWRDFVAMLAGIVGAATLFAAFVIPPLLLLALLISHASATVGGWIIASAQVVPVACLPIITGRLVGAFVFTNGVETGFDAAPVTSARDVARRPRRSDAPGLAELQKLAETNPLKALLEAERMLAEDPTSLDVSVEIAVLLDAVGSRDRALKHAKQTIARSLETEDGTHALELYQYFVHDRAFLALSADECDGLSRVALANKLYDDALWCICAAESAGLTATRVQKRIIAIADAAAEAGQLERAVTFYQFFENTYPDSPFSDYCQRAIASYS